MSLPIRATNSDGSASTERSAINTGIFAACASFNTGVHPDDNRCDDDRIDPLGDEAPHRGELPIHAALRIVKMQIDTSGLATACMSAENAVRQSLSAPICENPIVSATPPTRSVTPRP